MTPQLGLDSALVRLSEIHANSRVFTTDGDFRVYRKNRNEPIDVLIP